MVLNKQKIDIHSYRYRENDIKIGFIAQNCKDVYPEMVGQSIEGERYMHISPGALIPVLVKAIQELEARLVALERS